MDSIKAFLAGITDRLSSDEMNSETHKHIVASLGMRIPDTEIQNWEIVKTSGSQATSINIKYLDGTCVYVKQVQNEHVSQMLKTFRISNFVEGPDARLQDTDWCVQGTLEECCAKMSINVNIEFTSHKLKNWQITKTADNFQIVLTYVSIYDGPDILITKPVSKDDVVSYLTDNVI